MPFLHEKCKKKKNVRKLRQKMCYFQRQFKPAFMIHGQKTRFNLNLPHFPCFFSFLYFSCKTCEQIYNTCTLPIRFSCSSFQALMLLRQAFCMRRCRGGTCHKMAIQPTHPLRRDIFSHTIFDIQFFRNDLWHCNLAT